MPAASTKPSYNVWLFTWPIYIPICLLDCSNPVVNVPLDPERKADTIEDLWVSWGGVTGAACCLDICSFCFWSCSFARTNALSCSGLSITLRCFITCERDSSVRFMDSARRCKALLYWDGPSEEEDEDVLLACSDATVDRLCYRGLRRGVRAHG